MNVIHLARLKKPTITIERVASVLPLRPEISADVNIKT